MVAECRPEIRRLGANATSSRKSRFFSATLWEMDADRAAGEGSGGYYQVQIARGAHFFAALPERSAHRVQIHV